MLTKLSKKKMFLFITAIFLSVICITWRQHFKSWYLQLFNKPRWIQHFKAGNLSRIPRIILVWNSLWDEKNWGFNMEPEVDFIGHGCPASNCVVTDQRSMLRDADAVVFHVQDETDRPPFKLKHQRWVFYSHEPPQNVVKYKLELWHGLFNWTITYRRDGDIYIPYGYYSRRLHSIQVNFSKIVKSKNKLVAWMVSNCDEPSKRDDYVQELMKYIPVDVYGKCTKKFGQNNICTKKEQCKCENMINISYKFYLAFENCFHKDYVTEKYFRMLKLNVVLVVRGDGNYTDIGPPNSYIDTRNFKSPKELANFLIYLDNNDEEYIKYLSWKEHFTARTGTVFNMAGFCDLCIKLNNRSEPPMFYNNISQWYGACRLPDDIIIS